MSESSRAKARAWPYPRQADFDRSLRNTAAGWFKGKGFAVQSRYPYILDEWENWPKNIIVPEVASYIAAEQSKRQQARSAFPLHKYIHHGLSSQAMVFNLVGPLIVRNDLEPLKIVLERSDLPWPGGQTSASFECEDRQVFNEDSGQPTSIDLVIEGKASSHALYIESKFVEKEFGGCSVFAAGDCDGRNPAHNLEGCFLHHIGRRYWELLGTYGFLQGPMGDNVTCILATYYQFFREVLFAIAKGGYFVLLHDARNPAFVSVAGDQERGLYPLLRSLVPEQSKSKVQAITIQQMVEAIKQSGHHQDWIGEFEAKYGLT